VNVALAILLGALTIGLAIVALIHVTCTALRADGSWRELRRIARAQQRHRLELQRSVTSTWGSQLAAGAYSPSR
jgi:DNA-binding transcriptional regulator YdaS (Cro superfamily)